MTESVWRVVASKSSLDGTPLGSSYALFYWQVRLLHNDIIVGAWGGPTQSVPMHLVVFSPESLERNIRRTLQDMLRNYDMELWRQSPSDFELHTMLVEECGEILH